MRARNAQATPHREQKAPPAVSMGDLRHLTSCRACGSARLAPTSSLLGHVVALGVAAPFYPRGKKCGDCGWSMEADY